MMSAKSDKSIGRILAYVARLHRARLGERLSALGLFPGQEVALQELAQTSPMTMGDLAAALKVKPPTISKTIGRLSAQGLVERVSGGRDARLVQVALTESGQEKVRNLAGVWEEVERDLVAKLDAKEIRQLRKLLRRASKGLVKGLEKSGALPDAEDDEDDIVVQLAAAARPPGE